VTNDPSPKLKVDKLFGQDRGTETANVSLKKQQKIVHGIRHRNFPTEGNKKRKRLGITKDKNDRKRQKTRECAFLTITRTKRSYP
jgi:hypothetical protein